MLSRQQRSAHFLLLLSASRAEPYHHPLLRSNGITRWERSAPFHLQSACIIIGFACIIIGFFFTEDLKYSHARAPSPCLAKPPEQWQRSQCVRSAAQRSAHDKQEEERLMHWQVRARGDPGEEVCKTLHLRKPLRDNEAALLSLL